MRLREPFSYNVCNGGEVKQGDGHGYRSGNGDGYRGGGAAYAHVGKRAPPQARCQQHQPYGAGEHSGVYCSYKGELGRGHGTRRIPQHHQRTYLFAVFLQQQEYAEGEYGECQNAYH